MKKLARRKKLGLAFPDQLMKVNQSFGNRPKKEEASSSELKDLLLPNLRTTSPENISPWRLVILSCLFLIVFFALFLRLFHLQMISGGENRRLADSNRVQNKILHAPRGVIYDRNGRVLAENNPAFRLEKKILDRDEALALEAKNDPQLSKLEIDTVRSYPYGVFTSHILGYVGEISEDEIKTLNNKDPKLSYRSGDRVGRAGIEQFYESALKGKDGAEVIEVDAAGKKLRTLRKIDPVPGQNIHLSADIDLQKAVYQALVGKTQEVGSCCGAAVVEDAKSGEILAMVSIPSFDANVFTDPKREEKISSYFNDPHSPLLNRAVSGLYPPGSTFKIATALAGLFSGKIDSQTIIEDVGEIYLGPFRFANWYFTEYGRKEGPVDIIKALQRSNDIFFYRVGEMVGEVKLAETAKKVGIGRRLGIDLPGEESGLLPDNTWKKETKGEPWYPGDTLHMAIGQGFLLTTPLQILAETQSIAGNGQLLKPHLVTKITQPDGSLLRQITPTSLAKNTFQDKDVALVRQGLAKVPASGGTAWPFFTFTIPTAGKTGTAEFGDKGGRTHAWYTSFAPLEDPKIVLTVLVEAGGEGSNVSAPVAKEIYTWYFSPDKNHLKNFDSYSISTQSAKTLGE